MVMGFGMMFGLSIIIPVGLFAGILWIASSINTADPWMVDVVLRQFKYRKYYAPQSDLGVEHPQIRDFT
jgi:type IV secretory pathway TrbD component